MTRRWVAAVCAVVATAALLTSCGSSADQTTVTGNDRAQTIAGSKSALDDYVAAIQNGDLAGATNMSDPAAVAVPEQASWATDITAALPGASKPMSDVWTSFSGMDFNYVDANGDGEIGAGENESTDIVWWRVSYRVGEHTGAALVELELTGEDPADADNWMVTDGLLESVTVRVQSEHIAEFSVAQTVKIATNTTDLTTLWGYPGAYSLEVAAFTDPQASAEPIVVHVGVVVPRNWDYPSYPELQLTDP